MPYVHLSNGDVVDLSTDEWIAAQEESGTPSAYHRDGLQYPVIGVFAKEVEHPLSPEDQKVKDEKDAEDRAKFDEWQAHKKAGGKGTERPTTDLNENVPANTERAF